MKFHKKSVLELLALLVLLAVCISGCHQNQVDTVRVTGTVTLDGKPVDQGAIKFYAEDGETPGGGGTIKDGVYIADVPPGKKKVLINGQKVVGTEKLYDTPDSPTRDKLEQTTPAIYNSLYNSPLTADITKETKELNFELDSKVKNN